ncbi:MAG: hypothetical protein ACI9A1_001187 [Lentimonas sp.]|jgi:hypothetical protein
MNSPRNRATAYATLLQCGLLFILLLPSLGHATISHPLSERVHARGSYRYVYAMLFKLYDLTLYTDAPKQADLTTQLKGEHTLQLDFTYLRTIRKSIILESAEKMLQRNLSPNEYTSIAERLEQLNAAYTTVHKGDKSQLSYQKGQGTRLTINGQHIITIAGDDFGPLYFRIWLGKHPISTEMRDQLLVSEHTE